MIGCTKDTHNTGAATLDIHMDKKTAMSIIVNNINMGCDPALDKTKTASLLSKSYLLRAEAIVKPPNTNMITGSIIRPNMNLAASLTGIMSVESGNKRTPRTVTRTGIMILVTYSGNASVAQSIETNTRIARHLCAAHCSGLCRMGKKIITTATKTDIANGMALTGRNLTSTATTACFFLSLAIISRHTVLRVHVITWAKLLFSSSAAFSKSFDTNNRPYNSSSSFSKSSTIVDLRKGC
mmetsp:Transcript_43974/g.71541  ORF Transcript_43974/g.71541 Transcript_43974/m.71541 type:complete len:239 (+) Transcript_43974:1109-1825(+)